MTVVSQLFPDGVPMPRARVRPVRVTRLALAGLVVFGLSLAVPGARSDAQSAIVSRPPEVSLVTEKAIEKGLRFLAAHQQGDGSYSKESFGSSRGQTYPTAMTALVGLAFFSSGSTPDRGPYAREMRQITAYLLDQCSNTPLHSVPGLIYNPRAREQRPMYCHAFSMTYLALVFAQEKDERQRERIRGVLHDAIELTERTQSREGGWGYTANTYDDEGTLVVTFLQALRTCRDAGIYVPKRIVDRGVEYITKSANPDGSVRYRVQTHAGDTRPGVTCASVVALWQAGRYEDPLLRRISDFVNRQIAPYWVSQWNYGHHAEYVNYYLAQSQHVLGGERWRDFFRKASAVFVANQNADGSWEGADDGDIYGTAIALLVLQLPYDRLTVYER